MTSLPSLNHPMNNYRHTLVLFNPGVAQLGCRLKLRLSQIKSNAKAVFPPHYLNWPNNYPGMTCDWHVMVS